MRYCSAYHYVGTYTVLIKIKSLCWKFYLTFGSRRCFTFSPLECAYSRKILGLESVRRKKYSIDLTFVLDDISRKYNSSSTTCGMYILRLRRTIILAEFVLYTVEFSQKNFIGLRMQFLTWVFIIYSSHYFAPDAVQTFFQFGHNVS